jgi:acyl-CoA synthetase (AMP-forming)/AMP-acid ligase II
MRTVSDVLRHHASIRPNKIALESNEHTVTFGRLNERINRLNNAVASLGVKKGDRVAILSRNRIEYVESYGLSKAGLIVVPLNWRLAAAELTTLVIHSAPRLLIVDEHHRDLVDNVRAQWTTVKDFLLLGRPTPGWMDYEALIEAAADTEPATKAMPDDVLCIVYTSGTTGMPKGVAITHAAALGNCRTAATQMLKLTEYDKAMAVMPLFHVGGMWYHLFPSLATGCETFISAEFDPALVLKHLSTRQITNVHLVPSMISALLSHPNAQSADLSSVRLMFYAASSMPADLLKRAMMTFSQCGFAQSYGSTEAGVVTVLDPADHQRARNPEGEHLLRSCGRPFTGHEVRIVGNASTIVDERAVGEIEVRSPNMMRGYWQNDTETERAMSDGWLRSGDLGYLDAEGYLYIVDRKHDLIITGGENVFPSEVERYLCRDPEVLEATVFSIPDPRWVEAVVAAVVLKPGSRAGAEEILTRLRGHIAGYKCPKTLFFVAQLPKSAAGKVLRNQLRKTFAKIG